MVDETGALNPVTAYGESKVMSERDISRPGGGRFLSGLFAARDSIRPITAVALRYRSEQSRCVGIYNRQNSS